MSHLWLFLWLSLGWYLLPIAAQAQTADEGAASSRLGTATPAEQGTSPDLAAVSRRLVSLTNAFRQEHGLEPVETNPQLMEAAQDFANFMARTDQYGHTADGRRPGERARQHGYDYCLIAENIAYQYSTEGFTEEELAQGFFQGWKDSPDHRKNMLEPAHTEIGVGVAQSEKTAAFYAVQLFGRPQAQRIEFHIANQSATVVSYTINGRAWQLPPRYTRTHQECRPPTLTVQWPDPQGETAVQPRHGAQYTVVPGESGEFRLQGE